MFYRVTLMSKARQLFPYDYLAGSRCFFPVSSILRADMQNEVIGKIMDKTLDNIRDLVNGEVVIGKAIPSPDGSVVLPVSKVTVGMVSGGGEYGYQSMNGDYSGAGAGGAGVSVTPIGFLVMGKVFQKFIPIDEKESGSKWMSIVESVTKVFSKKKGS